MFAALIRRFSLPLLAKDLVETANRRRTYILRVVYALLLYSGALLLYMESTDAYQKTALELLGTGEELLTITFSLQCFGICLFMPALSVGAFTIEKEKNTLTLLFLTRLGPWTILFEKYLARVVHMGSYLLISLPLLGIAYSLGGVTQLQLWTVIWTLFVFTAQVGAISIACSTFFASTAAAFIWTYLIGVALYIFPSIYAETIGQGVVQQLASTWELILNRYGSSLFRGWSVVLGVVLPLLGYDAAQVADSQTFRPIGIYIDNAAMPFFPMNLMASTFWGRTAPSGPAAWHVLARTIPIACSIGVFLTLGRVWLVSRAVVIPKNRIMRLLRWIDGFFHRLNQNRWTKGMVIVNDTEDLPVDNPVAWRETKKRAFGTVRYLVRMLFLIELPVALICILFITLSVERNSYWKRNDIMSAMSSFVWILSLLFLVSKGATALPSERLGETFDVLLSTPMQTRDIIRQKFAGVNRLIWVLTIPIVTIAGTHAVWISAGSIGTWDPKGVGWYLTAQLAAVLIYPRMVAWLSMLMGLMFKSQTKAIFTTLAVLVGWCILPIVALFIWDEILDMPLERDSVLAHIAWAQSPVLLVASAELAEFSLISVIVVVSVVEYVVVTVALREVCLSSAAAMLGRPESNRPFAGRYRPLDTRQETGVRKL